jgi:hypothetical protein
MNTCYVVRSSRPAGLFSIGLLNGLPVRLRRPHLREAPAGFGLERLAMAFMNNPGQLNQPVIRKCEVIIGAGGKGSQGRNGAAWMVPFARRVRTIRMSCLVGARGLIQTVPDEKTN